MKNFSAPLPLGAGATVLASLVAVALGAGVAVYRYYSKPELFPLIFQ
ncbi:hypothetical protein [Bradyrhizobium roseum]|nr:hypothetical protein [Bradyrhizobium roseus]WKA28310.1 hypothetical protein QUH67_33035 [Bradyrhizobium roseus]